MPKPAPELPDESIPQAPAARTFVEMVDSLYASVRMIEQRLGMTYRTYMKRREQPSELSLAEVYRLADWLGEPVERIARELMTHTVTEDKVLGPGIRRHPEGVKRAKKGEQPDQGTSAEA